MYSTQCICSETEPESFPYRERKLVETLAQEVTHYSEKTVRVVCDECKSESCPCSPNNKQFTTGVTIHNNRAEKDNKRWGEYTTDSPDLIVAQLQRDMSRVSCACEPEMPRA